MEFKEKVIASLADLKQDIAGPIPAEIIKNWVGSDRSIQSHRRVLKPYSCKGFSVCSDTAGLSKMTQGRSLLEVMRLVSEPKELVYAAGKALGGRGVGVWAADNTQMFYDQGILAEDLLKAMIKVQQELALNCSVKIGMAIHFGEYFELGKGFFGTDAEFVEQIAEDETQGGEIVISEAVRNLLPESWNDILELREDLNVLMPVYRVKYESFVVDCEIKFAEDKKYPLPFSEDFFEIIADDSLDLGKLENGIMEKYLSRKAVIFVKVSHPERELLLEELTDWVVMNSILANIYPKFDVDLVKSNGELGIFVTENANEAVAFSRAVFDALNRTNDIVNIGVASGEILLFKLEDGSYDLAGNSVNIASKISEDLEVKNSLYIHETVVFSEAQTADYKPFSLMKSGVELRGFYLENK